MKGVIALVGLLMVTVAVPDARANDEVSVGRHVEGRRHHKKHHGKRHHRRGKHKHKSHEL